MVEVNLVVSGSVLIHYLERGLFIQVSGKRRDQIRFKLLNELKWRHDEAELCQPGLLLFLDRHPHPFQNSRLMHHVPLVVELDLSLINPRLWEEVCFSVTSKLPNINTVCTCCTNNLSVVTWIEHYICDWVCVSNKCLEVM